MTICIAAACQSHGGDSTPALVCVVDTSISLGGMTSIETGVKGGRIGDEWNAMFAGEDVSFVGEVFTGACGDLIKKKDESLDSVRLSVSEAYQKVRKKRIEEIYLSPLGWNLEQFLSLGKKLLPAFEYSRLLGDVQRYDLGCEFLIGGFDKFYEHAHIFHVVNPGTVIPNDAFGFGAIGSGAPAAYAYLARRDQNQGLSIAQTVYNVLGAKIFAEKALGIGWLTAVLIFEKGKANDTTPLVPIETVNAIREIWEKEENAVRPANLENRVKDLLDKAKVSGS